MLPTFVIVGLFTHTIYWGNLMSIEAILILQLSLSVIGLLVWWNVGSLVGTSDALFWLTRSKHLEKFEIPSGKVRYIYPVQDKGDLIIFLTKDTDKDGQYSEYDNDFVYKLNLQSKNIEEIVDSKLIYNIREILQEQ